MSNLKSKTHTCQILEPLFLVFIFPFSPVLPFLLSVLSVQIHHLRLEVRDDRGEAENLLVGLRFRPWTQ